MKMVAGGPFVIYLAGAGIERRTGATHLLDDPPGVLHEDPAVVDMLLLRVEDDRRGPNGVRKAGRLDDDAMTRAEALIAFALKSWPRIDQREIDVEENSRRHCSEPSYGPATVIVARDGCSVARAAA